MHLLNIWFAVYFFTSYIRYIFSCYYSFIAFVLVADTISLCG